jgi:hypothetical protein
VQPARPLIERFPALATPGENKQAKSNTSMKQTRILLTIAILLSAGGALLAHDGEKHPVAGVPASYPLKKCVVSGDALGEMGKPVEVTHDHTDVYLCCKACIKDFQKDPAKFTAMVKAANKH